VLIDISVSTTANGRVRRSTAEGEPLPGPWLIDAAGNVSDQPSALLGSPPCAVLPPGGLDLGHKRFGLGLLVEALTSALTGFGSIALRREQLLHGIQLYHTIPRDLGAWANKLGVAVPNSLA
jgi:LDH2 family malate/lactate/ureidoglycolate dehydrogenase